MKKSGSSRSRLHSKSEIRSKAKKGYFDRNPMLTSPHEVTCNRCGYRQWIIYLEYLKAGRFEVGRTQTVEVYHAAPLLVGLDVTKERITPLILKVRCGRCRAEIPHSPVSVEYLLFTLKRGKKWEYIYV